MSISLTRILPRSSMTRVHQNRFIRIINRSNTSVSSRTISQVVSVAQEVHQSFEQPNLTMDQYVSGECAAAAAMVNHRVRKQVEGVKDADTVRGTGIPGSPGFWQEITGLHHISDVYFENFEIAVDVTAAQIKGNPLFTNCEALLIITEPDGKSFSEALESIYHNSQWMVMMFGF